MASAVESTWSVSVAAVVAGAGGAGPPPSCSSAEAVVVVVAAALVAAVVVVVAARHRPHVNWQLWRMFFPTMLSVSAQMADDTRPIFFQLAHWSDASRHAGAPASRVDVGSVVAANVVAAVSTAVVGGLAVVAVTVVVAGLAVVADVAVAAGVETSSTQLLHSTGHVRRKGAANSPDVQKKILSDPQRCGSSSLLLQRWVTAASEGVSAAVVDAAVADVAGGDSAAVAEGEVAEAVVGVVVDDSVLAAMVVLMWAVAVRVRPLVIVLAAVLLEAEVVLGGGAVESLILVTGVTVVAAVVEGGAEVVGEKAIVLVPGVVAVPLGAGVAVVLVVVLVVLVVTGVVSVAVVVVAVTVVVSVAVVVVVVVVVVNDAAAVVWTGAVAEGTAHLVHVKGQTLAKKLAPKPASIMRLMSLPGQPGAFVGQATSSRQTDSICEQFETLATRNKRRYSLRVLSSSWQALTFSLGKTKVVDVVVVVVVVAMVVAVAVSMVVARWMISRVSSACLKPLKNCWWRGISLRERLCLHLAMMRRSVGCRARELLRSA